MTHLTEDQIMRIAEATENQLPYDDAEKEMLLHLKSCESCYERFCSSLALLEVTSESGYLILSEIYGMEYAKSLAARAGNKILAVVNLVKTKLMENIDIILEQVDREGDALRFRPTLATAARGQSDASRKMYKVEDVSDEKTFIIMDPESDELLIQINAKTMSEGRIRAYLKLESGKIIDCKLEPKGKIYKGSIKGLPTEKFQIVIEETD